MSNHKTDARRRWYGFRPVQRYKKRGFFAQRDRRFGDDLGRQSLLHAFALLEGRDDLVHQYRRRIATLMH